MFRRKPVDINKSFIINYASIFSRLKNSEKRLIIQKSEVRHYKKGETIYRQNDPPDAFYCVISGRVRISRFKDNVEEALEFLTCGMYFGIISLLTTQTHSVSAKAVNDTLVLSIKKDDFNFILEKVPHLAVDLSKTLSHQIRTRDYARAAQKSNIVCVYSAIKGIGRTMYSANLAISLRKETGKRVILLEVSQSGKDLLNIFNMDTRNELIDLEHSVLQKDIVNNFVMRKQDLGIDFLSIAHNSEKNVSSERVSQFLTLLTNDYQYVIIDLPVQRDDFVFKTLEQSDTIHILTDYEIENIKSTRKLMVSLYKNVNYPLEKIRIIVNAKKDSTKIVFEEIIILLDHDIFANIPVFWQAEDRVSEDSLKIVLAQPDSEYAKAVRRIAREIGGVLVGLALGSGAAFGLAHIGVLKVLEKEKIPVDVVAGTSIGALIGALWVSGKSAAEIEDIMMGYNKNKMKVFKLLFDFCFPKTSLAKGRRVIDFLRKNIGNKTFYDVKIPFKVVACNLDKREKVVYESGNLVDAVRSSLAIPGIFMPTMSEGDLIVDGGILEPVPVDVLAKSGVKKIIAVNVLPSPQDMQDGYKNYKYYLEKKRAEIDKQNFAVRFLYRLIFMLKKIFSPNIFDIMVNSILAMEYVMAKEDCAKADVVIHPVIAGANWFEFFNAGVLIKNGELQAEKALPQIKAVVDK
jgi:NTE family protein